MGFPRTASALFVLGLGAACQPADVQREADNSPSLVFEGGGGEWVDLTHAFSATAIYWPTDTLGFRLEELAYGPTEGGWFYSSYRFSSAEHGGTHLDAPIHFAEGRHTSDEIPLDDLIGPAVVIDVAGRANPDYQVSLADFEAWEVEHGRMPEGAIVLLRTGWGSRWNDRTAYLGTDLTGAEAVPQLHFPGLHPTAAEWLVENRSVSAVGLDTPSLDYGQSTDFATHVTLMTANVPGFENVANLDRLPARGAYVVALPMKIEGGSGGPLRIVAFVPGNAAPDRDQSVTNDLADLGTDYAAAWSGGDPGFLASFYAEDGRLSVNGAVSSGRDAIRATASEFMAAFPDMQVTMDSILARKGGAVFHWHWTGTNTGPGGSGRAVDLHGYEEWSFGPDSLIASSDGHFDDEEYRLQMEGD